MSITKLRAKAEELFGTDYNEFEELDVFNRENVLKGFICRRSTELYGALLITHVNGVEHPQLVYGTPKMHYPFDKQDRYNFPSAKMIECYEKLDGTNILAYNYIFGQGLFQTYKTRLTPTVRSGRFGDFYNMWAEMINRYPLIEHICLSNGCSVSFELYGARNKHLLWYDTPLDCAVLFGIKDNGSIVPPTELEVGEVPIAQLQTTVDSNYVESYKQQQLLLQDTLVEKEDGYEGQEGQVWYLTTTGGQVIQFKCKPETIELIHFASGGLGKNIVRATAYNVFEHQDELTVQAVAALLLEEFTDRQIQAAERVIQRVVQEVNIEMELRQQVLEDYKALKLDRGLDILLDKQEVMRWFSNLYQKKDMRKIYTILKGASL